MSALEEVKTHDDGAVASPPSPTASSSSSSPSLITSSLSSVVGGNEDKTQMRAVYMEGFGATKDKVKVGTRPRPRINGLFGPYSAPLSPHWSSGLTWTVHDYHL
jgi:hypothetical protein